MNFFDHRPQLFRSVFGILVVFLLVLAWGTLYRYAIAPSDENWFRDAPSRVLVTTPVDAAMQPEPAAGNESLRTGDLVVACTGRRIRVMEDFREALAAADPDSLCSVEIFRPAGDGSRTITVRPVAITNAVREIPPSALVIDVTEGGASDRAGMKTGDLIVRINGKEFKTAIEADMILRRATIGKTFEYEVLRGNDLLTLHVTLASFGFPIAFLVFTLSGYVFLVVGAFLGLARPAFPAARLTGLMFVLFGYFMAVSIIQRDVEKELFVVIRNFTMVIAVGFAIPLFLHSTHYFPKEHPGLLARRWIRIGGYLLGAGFTAIMLLIGNPSVAIGFGVMLLYLIGVPLLYRRHASQEYKQLNRVIRWTWCVAGVGTAAMFLVFGVLNLGNPLWSGLSGAFLALVPPAYLYTIGRYRLLDMDLRVRRSIQYSFVSIVWAAASLIALLWVLSLLPRLNPEVPNIKVSATYIEVLDEPMPPDRREIFQRGLMIFAGIGIAIVFWRGKQFGQRFIDRKFHRSTYDYRRAATELAEVMATRLDMEDLARGIVERLGELMSLKRAGVVFFRHENTCCCREAHGFDGKSWKEFCLATDEELMGAIQRFKGEFSVEYLPGGLKESFRQQQLQYVIPIRSKHKLVGAILVGEKKSETPFHGEDLEFLASVAKQASVAVENAFLHEELTEQERMKHELEIARRIQLESLPQGTPRIPGLDIAGVSIPAMEVGGDYFDYLNGEASTFTVIVGDVSGKGTSAALYMSKVQGILRSLNGFGLTPRELFIRANRLLRGDLEKKSFITAIGGTFLPGTRQLTVARAGHLPLFHFSARSGRVERVVPRGLGLGISASDVFAAEIEERHIPYEGGDVFLFVTDGITEGYRTDGEQFGEERLATLLQSSGSASAREILDRVVREVGAFTNGMHQHDDQTVVVVRAQAEGSAETSTSSSPG